MRLAWKELKYNWRRYALISIIVLLMMFMVLSLSGLVNGLGRAVSSSVESLDAQSFVLSDDSEKLLTVSNLSDHQYQEITKQTKGKTTSLDVLRTYIQTANSDEKKDAVYFAIDPHSFLSPSNQLAKSKAENPVVLDDAFQEDGIQVGDHIKDASTGVVMSVCGFVSDQMYGHVSVIYMSSDTYASIMKKVNPQAYVKSYHAIAVQSNTPKINVDGTAVYSKSEIINSIPGYRAEQSTITMVIWMLVIITAVIIGIFFYMINLQKEKEFGVLKAIGTSMRQLRQFILCQVLLIASFGAILAAILTQILSYVLPSSMPFYLNGRAEITILLAFVLISLVGGLVSVRRVAKIDPAMIIGGDN